MSLSRSFFDRPAGAFNAHSARAVSIRTAAGLVVFFVLFLVTSSTAMRAQDLFDDEDDVDPREQLEEIIKRTVGSPDLRRPDVLGNALLRGSPRVNRRAALRLRRGRYSFTFKDTALADVLDTFREVSGLTFIVSAKARKALKGKDIRVSLRLRNLRLDSHLNLLANHLGDYRFLIWHGAVHMVHVSEYRRPVFLRVYYVGDLVRRRTHFRAPKMGL